MIELTADARAMAALRDLPDDIREFTNDDWALIAETAPNAVGNFVFLAKLRARIDMAAR